MCKAILPTEKEIYQEVHMKTQFIACLAVAAFAVTSISANAVTNKPHSKTLVVESPSDLPALAQANSEAMYLHKSEDGKDGALRRIGAGH